MSPEGALFSVVIPSRGDARLARLLDDLAAQTLPRERFEVIVALDGAGPAGDLSRALERAGATLVRLSERRGPGA
ncbi:MAG TPA: glycosyltransferase family 2 protein, partial [Candidatus Eisenbacteria bacterium]|nr:glycosyltransferase family 2 protein [Candidatus Eisenbacteria bacterium]